MRMSSHPASASSGWFRVWVVGVLTLFAVFLALAVYVLWGQATCYRFVTISALEKTSSENTVLVAHLQKETETRTYCGRTEFSALLTLEQLAKDGVVTQVGMQWQEPRGWSFSDLETLDILEPKEIRASLMHSRMHDYVFVARLRLLGVWLACLAAFSVALLLLGVGIAWVRRGFGAQRRAP